MISYDDPVIERMFEVAADAQRELHRDVTRLQMLGLSKPVVYAILVDDPEFTAILGARPARNIAAAYRPKNLP